MPPPPLHCRLWAAQPAAGHYVLTFCPSRCPAVLPDVCPVPTSARLHTATMAVGQHAVHASESIPVPTWTRPQADELIRVQNCKSEIVRIHLLHSGDVGYFVVIYSVETSYFTQLKMLPNDNVSMSVGHLDQVLIVYSYVK